MQPSGAERAAMPPAEREAHLSCASRPPSTVATPASREDNIVQPAPHMAASLQVLCSLCAVCRGVQLCPLCASAVRSCSTTGSTSAACAERHHQRAPTFHRPPSPCSIPIERRSSSALASPTHAAHGGRPARRATASACTREQSSRAPLQTSVRRAGACTGRHKRNLRTYRGCAGLSYASGVRLSRWASKVPDVRPCTLMCMRRQLQSSMDSNSAGSRGLCISFSGHFEHFSN
jgi:hypothetical protein